CPIRQTRCPMSGATWARPPKRHRSARRFVRIVSGKRRFARRRVHAILGDPADAPRMPRGSADVVDTIPEPFGLGRVAPVATLFLSFFAMDVSRSRALPTDVVTSSPDIATVSSATLRVRVAVHPDLRERVVIDGAGQARACCRDARLGSAFSCISDVADPAAPRVFARRAVLQVHDAAGLRLPAEEFFKTLDSDGDLADADRLSRSVCTC
ncbi:MAG: hypothetical protein ACRYGL_15445, partial [Janthinobacterium lividum]